MVEILNWITTPISVIMSGSTKLVESHPSSTSILTLSHSFSMATQAKALELLIKLAGEYFVACSRIASDESQVWPSSIPYPSKRRQLPSS
jgi:hypothetical protein